MSRKETPFQHFKEHTHLEESAVFTRKHLQIWRVDKDATVDML